MIGALRYPGVYDCSAAERDLGFRPSVPPAEGLVRNVQYLEGNDLIEAWAEDEEYEQVVRLLAGG